MAIPFLNNLDLRENEIWNVRLQNTGSISTPGTGQIYFNTGDNKAKYYDGTNWINIGDDTKYTVSSVNLGNGSVDLVLAGTDSTTSEFTFIPGNNITLTHSAAGITITGADAPSGTVDLIGDVLASGTTGSDITTAFNFAGSSIVTSGEGIGGNSVDTALVTSAAVKSYVDAAVAGGAGAMVFQGSYNAATNTPDLDTSPAGINKGFAYTVSAAGTFFTEAVEVGDLIVANIDNPTTLTDWTRVQKNIDLATGSTVGIGNVTQGTGISVSYASGTATVTNTDLGSSQNIFKNIAVSGQSTVTADSNNDTLTIVGGTNIEVTTDAGSDTITINNTATTPVTGFADTISVSTALINHALNSTDVIVQLFDTVTGETVYADVERTGLNTVDVTFSSAPTNPVRVLVTKI